jgi:Tol biopolymer transport system component
MNKAACVIILFTAASMWAYAQESPFPVLNGKYIDKDAPGDEAAVFAGGIISTDGYEHSAPAFSPDGKTVIWGIVDRDKPSVLLEMKKIDGKWARPQPVSFSAKTSDDMYPAFSVDGKKLYFGSRRPLPSGAPVNDIRIWVVEYTSSGWGTPLPLDSIVSQGFEYAHSISKRGTIFFSTRKVDTGRPSWQIYYSKLVNGKYQQPEKLAPAINDGSYVDGPYVSPDERFLIFESDREGGMGSNDLYICFKQKDGSWGIPKNMGPKVNSSFSERFAGLSPDGKCFFFSSNRGGALPDIYWINADFIERLK